MSRDAVKLKVATRGSALALWQTEWVIARLRELHGPELAVEIVTIRTRGDQVQNVPIAQIGGKGVFVTEIEHAILSGAADFGVHSLKDMPAAQPSGLALVAIPEREDPRDALVLGRSSPPSAPASSPSEGHALAHLEHGASVGTTSRRRGAQLLHERPDLRIEMLRGNLDTRLRKLDMGQHDAVILAAAGLRRLGFADRISQLLPLEQFVPCAGQGALAIEAREDDPRIRSLLEPLQHPASALCVRAEREVLRRMGASCHTPLGAHASLQDGQLTLHGMLASPDGADMVRVTTHAPAADPEAAGGRLADRLVEGGGERILASLDSSGER
jgi:hydroxymethylbilane synthase